jgi:hypothetical protein
MKDRAVSMNYIKAEQNGNLQARLFDSDVLKLVRLAHATHIQSRSQQALAREVWMLVFVATVSMAIELLQLSQFFRERHAGE